MPGIRFQEQLADLCRRVLAFLGEVADQRDLGANIVMELICFSLIDAALACELVHKPVHQTIVI